MERPLGEPEPSGAQTPRSDSTQCGVSEISFEGLTLRIPLVDGTTDPMRLAVRAVGRVAGTRFERRVVKEVSAAYGVEEEVLRGAVEDVYGSRTDPNRVGGIQALAGATEPPEERGLRADALNRWRAGDIEHAILEAEGISAMLDRPKERKACKQRVETFVGTAVRGGYLAVLLRDYRRLRALEAQREGRGD